jgi:hypothetical protein
MESGAVPIASQYDIARLATYADSVLDLAHARHGEGYFYQSLPLCVLDAVFSLGVRYQAVRNVVARYCAEAGAKEFRQYGSSFPSRDQQESISSFCARLRSWGTFDQVAARLGSRQRTSTHPTSSILKAEASLRFAEQLRAHGIEYLQDMAELIAKRESEVEMAIRNIRGQGSGLSWNYFRMLSGSEDMVKADRMVLRFVATALGRHLMGEVAAELVRGAARALQTRYPQMTPRLLDGAIWSYQSELAATRGAATGRERDPTSSDVFVPAAATRHRYHVRAVQRR